MSGLPSWVPDWTVPFGQIPFSDTLATDFSESFRGLPGASAEHTDWQGSVQLVKPFKLQIWGINTDRITQVGNIITMSKEFLLPLFLADSTVLSAASVTLDVVARGANLAMPSISDNMRIELFGRLAHWRQTFEAAARAEDLDSKLVPGQTVPP